MRLRHCFTRRARFKLYACVVISFILFMSFKILEPRHSENDIVDVDGDEAFMENQGEKDNPNIKLHRVEGRDSDIEGESKENLIKRFIEMYELDWQMKMESSESWRLAASWVTSRRIHPDHAPEIGGILNNLATETIVKADFGFKGTQLKLTLELKGGQKVAFKPKWFERDHIVKGKPYDGNDRHNGEIAGFHLNRLLGLNRSPLVVGRVVNLKTEIIPVANAKLVDTFFAEGNNTCFLGKCRYCRTKADAVCGEGDMMESAVVLWLPTEWTTFTKHRNPWQRTYIDDKQAKWEVHEDYCDYVQKVDAYKSGPRLMDLMDSTLFDYLIGNADRHHYETFTPYNESMLVMLDSAKSFGNPHHDEASILMPLIQCCKVRHRLWERLRQLKDGVLSSVLRTLLSHDPVHPVLSEPHYKAMDRRLTEILYNIDMCVQKHGPQYVFVRDKWSHDES